MPFDTPLTRLLGIRIPVVQGGLQWVAYAELAAAVSNAGGLGIINALIHTDAESLRREIRKTRSLTSKPFGVNVTLLPSLHPPDYPTLLAVSIAPHVHTHFSRKFELTFPNRSSLPKRCPSSKPRAIPPGP
jgi:NAD(P)H-dependent flavin oxidoreductase YrpB (nitropropane dioxygenase family)